MRWGLPRCSKGVVAAQMVSGAVLMRLLLRVTAIRIGDTCRGGHVRPVRAVDGSCCHTLWRMRWPSACAWQGNGGGNADGRVPVERMLFLPQLRESDPSLEAGPMPPIHCGCRLRRARHGQTCPLPGGEGGWHDARLFCFLQLTAPIGLSPVTLAQPFSPFPVQAHRPLITSCPPSPCLAYLYVSTFFCAWRLLSPEFDSVCTRGA